MSAAQPTSPACHPPESAAGEIRIDGPLTVAFVESWRAHLSAALGRSPALTVDLAAVSACDVFGLQLLWAARRSAESRAGSFALINPGDAFADACKSAGLDPAGFELNPTEHS
jgi:anti-anti-sigma regulatory factor